MTTYAIRLSPEALQPARTFSVVVGPRGGRSMMPNIEEEDRRETVLERALRQMGVSCYLPVMRREIIHHRTKRLIVRDFPMIPGFAFVSDIRDFAALEEAKGVSAVVRDYGRAPVTIPDHEIAALSEAEREAQQRFDRQMALKAEKAKRPTRKRIERHFPTGTRVNVKSGWLAGNPATILSATGRKTVRAIIDRLGASVEISLDDIEIAA